jgi:hypothetical protein
LRGWLVAALRPRGPYPLLAVHGEQGAAKSAFCRLVRNLIDANTAALRAEPRDARDLIIAATNGWIVALDNVSSLPVWLSDALCRLATGGGFGTRELYSDAEEVLFDAQRPTILNGITEVTTRADLLDRTLLIEAPRIEEHQRRTEDDLMAAFAAARPRLLGALLDAVVAALANIATVKLDRLPRMADFAVWATAADPAGGDAFIRAYRANRAGANDIALEASEIAPHVRGIVDQEGQWTGTAAELLTLLNERVEEKHQRQQGWPRTPRGLSGALRRVAPNLRAAGIGFEAMRGRRRVLTLTQLERPGDQPTPPTPQTLTVKNHSFSRDGTTDGCSATDAATDAKERSNGAADAGCDGIDGDLQPLSTVDEERF